MKAVWVGLSLGIAAWGWGDTTYFAVYIGGKAVGYQAHSVRPDRWEGRDVVVRNDHSEAVFAAGMPKVIVDITCWSDGDGNVLRLRYVRQTYGTRLTLEATLSAGSFQIDTQDLRGKSHKSLNIPAGAVVRNYGSSLLEKPPVAESRPTYILDPSTGTLQKETLKAGKGAEAELTDSDGTVRVFYGPDGHLTKLSYSVMDAELLPVTKDQALALVPKGGSVVDMEALMQGTSIRMEKRIFAVDTLSEVKLRVTGADLSTMPSDEGQTVTKDGDSWIVDIHPKPISGAPTLTVEQAAVQGEMGQWLKPGLYMPSDSSQFKELAHKITAKSRSVVDAALAIKNYVFKTMRDSPAKAELADATEILKSKQGLCGRYAVLTTTLLRAAGIPARMAAGMVAFDDTFYYHSWCEAWDGKEWLGIDSTVPEPQLSPGHLKLAQGNVDEARGFAYFGLPKIELIGTEKL